MICPHPIHRLSAYANVRKTGRGCGCSAAPQSGGFGPRSPRFRYRRRVEANIVRRSPFALRPGSRVVAIAPSSPFDVAAFDVGLSLLRERYHVDHRADLTARAGFLAGDDDRRLQELQDAIDDDSVEAIIAARGGYGAARLLDRLDLSALARRPKPIVGFSDITALHALWANAGVASIHGPMIATLGKPGTDAPRALSAMTELLEGRMPQPLEGLGCVRSGSTIGFLKGGNLSVLTALIGTPFMPILLGSVLFLEDIGERPYRVDRMLTTWRQAHMFDLVSGVVLGAFTDCDPGPDGVTVEDVLRSHLGSLKIPVLSGLRAGHIDDNMPLPFGATVEVDADAGTLKFWGCA